MEKEILVGRYRVIEKLSEGGMSTFGTVYDDLENREVALKEIKINENDRSLIKSSREACWIAAWLTKEKLTARVMFHSLLHQWRQARWNCVFRKNLA